MNTNQYKGFRGIRFGVYVGILHLIGFNCLFASTADSTLLGLGFLAYTLGMRHAFDADHIVAIDNTIRKLVQQKEDAVGVGF
ncbi:High-affinity nickel-transport protein [Pelosinus propionicus DSM 13327]|uniref:Nickel/cobalt efflux system n=1 Tax=Pelosinus propionicus DSM 13327 TaxID=1123291 RepID=A0A1I4M4N7_9FIRM|nr:High-affinity nickel-transport protein [Pelosinus propionicus DSM 13327]